MPFRRPSTITACLLAAAAVLPAADLLKDKPTGFDGAIPAAKTHRSASAIRDLRLGLGIAPGIENVDVTTPAWGGNATIDARISPAITPAFIIGTFWDNGAGLGLSFGVPWRRSAGNASNGDRLSISAYGLELAPLVAWRIEPRFHLELAIPLAAGFAQHEVPGLDGDRGDWWSTGLRLGGYWTCASGCQFGGELGWMAMTTMGRVKDGGGAMDITYHSRGPTAGITLGYRF